LLRAVARRPAQRCRRSAGDHGDRGAVATQLPKRQENHHE
jgi:hypothetical protein